MFALAGQLYALAWAIAAVAIPRDLQMRETVREEGDVPVAMSSVFRDGRLALLVAAGGLLSTTFTWFQADGLTLLREQHPLGTTAYGSLFAIAAAATVVLQMPATYLGRSHSLSWLVLVGAVCQAVGLALLAAASLGFILLVVAVLVIAVGQMLYGPAVSTFVTRRAAAARGATYQAAISTTEDIGSAIGPTTGLALGGIGQPSLVWLIAAPICLLAGGACAFATRADAPVELKDGVREAVTR